MPLEAHREQHSGPELQRTLDRTHSSHALLLGRGPDWCFLRQYEICLLLARAKWCQSGSSGLVGSLLQLEALVYSFLHTGQCSVLRWITDSSIRVG
jgi:hypothetical protein